MEPSKLPWGEMAQGLPGKLSTPTTQMGMGPALCWEDSSWMGQTPSPDRTRAAGPHAMPGAARNGASPTCWRGHRVSRQQQHSGQAPSPLP